MVLLRQELRGKKGIVLINSALLVESDMLNLCNNHVILVDAETSVRHARLVEFRKIDPVVAENRIKHMKSNGAKKTQIKAAIASVHFGKIVNFDNTESDINDIAKLYEQLKSEYNEEWIKKTHWEVGFLFSIKLKRTNQHLHKHLN